MPLEPFNKQSKTVAIFRSQLLPLSETFIRDQASSLRRWSPVLVGDRLLDALPLDGLAARACYSGGATYLQRFIGRACRQFDFQTPRLKGLIRTIDPTVIHAHFGFDAVDVWPIANSLGVPLIVTLHGADITTHMDWFERGKGGRRWKSYPRRLMRMAESHHVHFLAVSNNIRRSALLAGLPEERLLVLPIGIDLSKFTASDIPPSLRAPVVLFVGRLVEKKGCRFLIEAFSKVLLSVPHASLSIVGDGPERAQLEKQAASVPNVRFLGALDHLAVRELMQSARVFCLPSITAENGDAEGLPIVLLEAQASGLPVVTSARGGVDEGIEDGATGFGVREGDAEALAKNLIRLLTDDVLVDEFSRRGPLFVQKSHDIKTQTARLENFYDAVAASRAP